MKTCTKCSVAKELSAFPLCKGGHHSWCKKCKAAAMKQLRLKDPVAARAKDRKWYKINPELEKSTRLKSKFGITLVEYKVKSELQNNVCAICLQPESVKRGSKLKALAVDHNSSTGAIRDLLCQKCNQAFGLLKEDKTIIQNMFKYAEKHNK